MTDACGLSYQACGVVMCAILMPDNSHCKRGAAVSFWLVSVYSFPYHPHLVQVLFSYLCLYGARYYKPAQHFLCAAESPETFLYVQVHPDLARSGLWCHGLTSCHRAHATGSASEQIDLCVSRS
eukprot:jgi/Ulvmu1/8820/UM048_0076.1